MEEGVETQYLWDGTKIRRTFYPWGKKRVEVRPQYKSKVFLVRQTNRIRKVGTQYLRNKTHTPSLNKRDGMVRSNWLSSRWFMSSNFYDPGDFEWRDTIIASQRYKSFRSTLLIPYGGQGVLGEYLTPTVSPGDVGRDHVSTSPKQVPLSVLCACYSTFTRYSDGFFFIEVFFVSNLLRYRL